MGNIILIVVLLFIFSVVIAFIVNKKKEKAYENKMPEDVVKTKKVYKGSLICYINNKDEKTILRYFTSKVTNTIPDFVPNDEVLVNNSLILFDEKRGKIAIIQSIRKHGITQIIPFSDIISLEPVEISKQKKITRGGISPISIKGYRWASSTTKMLKQIERVYIEIKYRAYDQEKTCEITIFDGISYEDRSDYTKIVEEVNTIINKFHEVVAK